MPGDEGMKQLLELSGMWIMAIGFVVAVIGSIVAVATGDSIVVYAIGWLIGLLGVVLIFWSALSERLRARKTDDLHDVGFN
jgi:hypothetical protein